MNPSISVVIPLYNRAGLVWQVVESVLAQTLPVSEVILVDDGSMQDVEDVVRGYMAQKPDWRDRVKYFRQENQGQSVALNHGIAQATGDWIAFNANDDLWLPQKLEWQFKAIETFGASCGLCFTDAWFMNNPHWKDVTLFESVKKSFANTIGMVDDPIRLLLHNQPVWVQTTLARTELVRKIGGFDPTMRYAEDCDFTFRMALETKFCYVGMPMVLIDRTISPTRREGPGLNWQKEEFRLQMEERLLRKQLQLTEGLADAVRKAARANLQGHYSKWTNLHLKNRNYAKAKEAISTAARYGLTPGIAVKWILARLTPHLATRITMLREGSNASRGLEPTQ